MKKTTVHNTFIIVLFQLLVTVSSYACDCANTMTFCSHSDTSIFNTIGIEESVFMIEINRNAFYKDSLNRNEYYDAKIIDHFFGPPLQFDSISIQYNGSFCKFFDYESDTIIFKKAYFFERRDVNHHIVDLDNCVNDALWLENDSVFGNIFSIQLPWEPESVSLNEFLQRYEYECSQTARNPDLEELKGVELLQNPIYDQLILRNNLDKEIPYSIYGLDGKYLKQGVVPPNAVMEEDMLDLLAGVYFVRVHDGIGEKFHKVLKL